MEPIDAGAWWQYLYPGGGAGCYRRHSLGSATGSEGSARCGPRLRRARCFPALGFFNVFPMLFSFVADHFQYLASIGLIAGASAGATIALRRMGTAPTASLRRLPPSFWPSSVR